MTALSIGKAVLHNALSTTGILVSKVEREINYYKTQNTILSEEFLKASSLTNVVEKALASGFTSENALMVLKKSKSLAAKP